MTSPPDHATAHAWTALGGPTELLARVRYDGAHGVLPARLPVRELARATVGVCSLAAAELLARRGPVPGAGAGPASGPGAVPAVRVHEGAVATAFVSERHLRVDGRSATSFAPLSGFWRSADGWVRTHANYPHHRARLLHALDLSDTGDDRTMVERLADALASRPAREVQEAVYAADGLAVAVAEEPTAPGPPLVRTRLTDGPGPRPLAEAALPAAGVRVLDLTRVIAGPVATRTLALLGADVLRVDSPRLREDANAHADTGMGKRSTLLDLSTPADRRTFDDLLSTADVVLTGYRPGALDRLGLAPDDLLARRPGLVLAQLSAWDGASPWAQRRGFDSLVQAASGVAAVEAADDGTPGVLPAQALDHGTGYLLAAAVLRGLSESQARGGGRHVRLSLSGTASWLLHDLRPAPLDGAPHSPARWLTRTASPHGTLDHALPAVDFDGAPRTWARPAGVWGADPPTWR